MKRYRVVFAPGVEDQLAALYRYLARAASADIARRYTASIIHYCERLETFPHRGNRRDEVRPGLRTTHCKKRAVIALAVDDEQVSMLGVFYGGQDYETVLQEDSEKDPA